MPTIATLRQKEADLIRKWMTQMKTQHDGLFKDKEDMAAFMAQQMNLFYGGSR